MKLTIYHGSENIIKKPEYRKGKPYNDYGLGFYCTEDEELAKEWAVSENKDGYSNKYLLDIDKLKVLDLTNKKFTALHWITLLLKNRIFNVRNNIARKGKEYLINNFSIDIDSYDVIKGYRADDSYFSFAEAFINNTISINQLSKALKFGDLGIQVVLISKKAFESIEYVDSSISDSKIYYKKRLQRVVEANLKYQETLNKPFDDKDVYLSDIIRKKAKENDSRLQ